MSLRTTGKRWIKAALVEGGFVRLAARYAQPGIAILRYHSVQYDPERYANSIGSGIIHSFSAFRDQMELLARRFNPVTIDDALDFLCGKKQLPQRSVAVTLDDGYADNFEIAAPVMDHFGIRASFYVTVNAIEAEEPPWFCRMRHAFATTQKKTWTDSADHCVRRLLDAAERKAAFLAASSRCARLAGQAQEKTLETIELELEVERLSQKDCPMLTWDQIRRLHRGGHLVGSHTLTHPNLAHLSGEDLHKELAESKSKLEAQLSASAMHFSYPSPILEPHYTGQTVNGTRQAGYRTAVTCTPGPVHAGHDPLSLRRISAPLERNEFLWSLECTLLGRRV